MKFRLYLFIALLSITSVAYAQQAVQTDLYLKDFSFTACDDAVRYYELSNYMYEREIIHTADDGSYFDVQAVPPSDVLPTQDIFRTLCYKYTVGNKGEVVVQGDDVWQSFYITDENWPNKNSSQGSIAFEDLKPGATFTNTGSIEMKLNDSHGYDCVGMKVELLDNELMVDSDMSNNQSLICFSVDQYFFPDAPKTLSALSANGRSLELTWDKVPEVDTYEISANNLSPNKGFRSVDLVGIVDNSVTFDFPDDDFYCLYVRSVKDGVIGSYSSKLCYSPALLLFSDVPITSWYFPYLQELQANGIVNGYKNLQGEDIGMFGPADYLTVAETLKMAFTAFKGSETVTDAYLPLYLRNHWAAEYILKALQKDLSIIADEANFKPDRPITRGEILQMFTEIRGDEIPHYDVYTASDVADSPLADIVEYAYQNGFVGGYDDGTFKPDALLNRAEIVKILSNFRRW